MTTWLEHVARWKDCTRCPLAQQRSNIVIARGQVPCDVLFVGEAPGSSEDALGLPFVGPAGKLLDQIIAQSVPADVPYVLTNLVCCFPAEAKARGDNEPEVSEIEACRPRLVEFIELARPKLVVRVGRLAQDFCEHDSYGKILGAEVCDIDHPAYILRMPLVQRGYAVMRAGINLRNAVAGIRGVK